MLDAQDDPRSRPGNPGAGLAGFRRTHRQAQGAQAVALAAGPSGQRLTSFAEVAPLALMASSVELLRAWVHETLGPLATDDDHYARLRDTLRVFLQENGSFEATAERLILHKNSVQYRVRKAEDALGHPVGERRLQVELALLASQWLGPAVLHRPEEPPAMTDQPAAPNPGRSPTHRNHRRGGAFPRAQERVDGSHGSEMPNPPGQPRTSASLCPGRGVEPSPRSAWSTYSRPTRRGCHRRRLGADGPRLHRREQPAPEHRRSASAGTDLRHHLPTPLRSRRDCAAGRRSAPPRCGWLQPPPTPSRRPRSHLLCSCSCLEGRHWQHGRTL
jgi:hypothetical protein